MFSQLEEVGYLIQTASNEYQFYEEPQKIIGLAIPLNEEKRWMPQDDGTFILMTFNDVYAELKDNYHPDVIKEFWLGCRKEDE